MRTNNSKRERCVSQSKSEDNWLQDSLNESTSEVFLMTREEVREIKILRPKGLKDFADTYYEYLQLEKKEDSLDYTLKEFCKKRVLNIGFQNDRVFTGSTPSTPCYPFRARRQRKEHHWLMKLNEEDITGALRQM